MGGVGRPVGPVTTGPPGSPPIATTLGRVESRSGGLDLARLGLLDPARLRLDTDVKDSGDLAPAVRRHSCVAYRVFVRAEVACPCHPQDDRDAATGAARLADLALRHPGSGAVRLAVTGERR